MQLEPSTRRASPGRLRAVLVLVLVATGFACGAYSGPFSAGGWSTVEAGDIDVRSLYATSTDVFVVKGSRSAPRAELAHWNGKLWERIDVPPNSAVAGTSERDVWVAGGATLMHYDGTRWERPWSIRAGEVRAVWALEGGQVWFGGTRMRLSRERNEAEEHAEGRLFWLSGGELRTLSVDSDVRSVWTSGAGDVWVATDAGARHFDGKSWFRSDGQWNKIWGTSASDVWLVGDSLSVAHWNGNGWDPVSVRILANLAAVRDGAFLDVRGTAPGNAWAVGSHGIAIRWDGTRWGGVRTGTASELRAVWVGTDDVWIGGDGVLLRKF
jgi:hypothetical protein